MKVKSSTSVQGHVTVSLIDDDGNVVEERGGLNTWTAVGREYLAEIMSSDIGGGITRNDKISYIGAGSGVQVESASITAMVDPVEYLANTFFAPLDTPVFPGTNSNTTRTSVQFSRTYGKYDISLLSTDEIVLTEAGLFTNGDPASNYSVGIGTTMAESGNTPMAYKTFKPITKTIQYSLRIVWEVRFV